MINTIKMVITSILTALYQTFWFSVLLAILCMFLYLYITDASQAGKGWKVAVKYWISQFKTSVSFRRLFFLIFYTAMILFRTLLNRAMWKYPLADVIGTWKIISSSETSEMVVSTECLENLLLFIPFTVLLLWYQSYKMDFESRKCVWYATKITFTIALSIEFLQLFLQLGTFQLSDLFYNTLGGTFGGLIFCIAERVNKKKMHQRKCKENERNE